MCWGLPIQHCALSMGCPRTLSCLQPWHRTHHASSIFVSLECSLQKQGVDAKPGRNIQLTLARSAQCRT